MKLDFDLLRKILLKIERKTSGYVDKIEIDGFTEEHINSHLVCMIEAGLLEGNQIPIYGRDTPIVEVKRITFEGHKFIEASKDPTHWEKAKGIAGKTGGITLDIFLEILKKVTMGQVNELVP